MALLLKPGESPAGNVNRGKNAADHQHIAAFEYAVGGPSQGIALLVMRFVKVLR